MGATRRLSPNFQTGIRNVLVRAKSLLLIPPLFQLFRWKGAQAGRGVTDSDSEVDGSRSRGMLYGSEEKLIAMILRKARMRTAATDRISGSER